MKIGKKIQIITSSLVALVALVLFAIVFSEEFRLKKTVQKEIEKESAVQMKTIVSDVYNMCFALNEMVQEKVRSDLSVASSVLTNHGSVAIDNSREIAWSAVNQYSKQVVPVTLPAMNVGTEWLGQNKNFSSQTPVVDEVQQLVGGTCTIFQRMNSAGDMLRVATNVKKLDGERAIGTFIPAINEDGKANPVVSKVLRGETFFGRAYVVNAWYITAYKPLFDTADDVIGILYTGVKQEAVESLRKGMTETVVGTSGFVSAIETKGKFAGVMQINDSKISFPENLFDYKDQRDTELFDTIKTALIEKSETCICLEFLHSDSTEKLIAATYFPDWDWILFAITDKEDFMTPVHEISSALNGMKLLVLIIALVSIVVAIAVVRRFSRSITTPLNSVIKAAYQVRDGDISVSLTNDRSDEIGSLIEAFTEMAENIQRKVAVASTIANRDLTSTVELASEKDALGLALQKMTQNLNSVLSGIKQSSGNVAENSSQVSDLSGALSDGAVRSAAAVEEISSSVTEIDGQLRKSAEQAKDANNLSLEARKSVARGTEEMNALKTAMNEISNSSQAIKNILKLIDDIAF